MSSVDPNRFGRRQSWAPPVKTRNRKTNMRKTIKVVAAIIRKENSVFATQRGYGEYKDWWEFPGGKIESGETPEAALIRVEQYLTTVEHDYPEFHLSMDCYWCRLESGKPTLLEHEAAMWLPVDNLRQVNWLPADVLVVEAIEKSLVKKLDGEGEY